MSRTRPPQRAPQTQARRGPAVGAVLCACAVSAGIHAGLAGEHLRESRLLGVAFIAAVVVLLCSPLALALRPEDRRAAQAVAATPAAASPWRSPDSLRWPA